MTEPVRYRLRGDVGGVEQTFPLGPGESSLGSIAGNDVVLPVRGVSRRHAVVRFEGGSPVIQDLESRNGVLVNGLRSATARLKAGDEVRLGPVTLRVEEIDPADSTLAISIDAASPSPTAEGLPDWETTATYAEPSGGVPRGWLDAIEAFVERLSVVPEADVTGALAAIVKDLPAAGCCVVEWSGLEPVILGAAGRVGDAGALRGADLAARFRTLSGGAEGVVTWCLAPSQPRVGIMVWGDYSGRTASEPLLRTLLRLWQRLRPEPVRNLQERPAMAARGLAFPENCVTGRSPAMVSLYGQMKPLVQGDLPVLIVGETGAGKELIARILHSSSPRAKGPFVAVNCAAIPAHLLEAEMFGIVKGAATDVVARQGKFQLAHGGTLFLDEIGDMSLDLQAKLLRALQEREIQPVGSTPVPVNIRVVTATNADLLARIEDGRFRRDLYYRVAGYVLQVPPLRERHEDIATLVEAFLRSFSREAGKSLQGITLKALRALTDYDWPGNVRELEHEVRRLVYLCPEGGAVDSSLLSAHILAPRGGGAREPSDTTTSLDLDENRKQLEERLIRRALVQSGGNRTQAAKLLGVSRNGLAMMMQRLGIAD
jgi:DNA-binding NtrC family response regulator